MHAGASPGRLAVAGYNCGMPWSLIRNGFRRRPLPRFLPAPRPLKKSYEVAIIGAGGHGLACAYYLCKRHGVRDIAVFDKGWLGGGNTARNTAIIRSNYLTPEAVRFYGESMRMFAGLSRELDYNIMYSPRGHLTLAHTDADCRVAKWRANVNRHMGEDSEFIGRDDIARICPPLEMSQRARWPVLGALYHPPGAIARHDAVAWAYAARAAAMGASIFQGAEVRGVLTDGAGATGIRLAGGETVSAGAVLQATAGSSAQTAALAGLRLPITSIPLQAMASQPLAPFLDPIVVSGTLHAYVSQSARGELVMGGAVDPRPLQTARATLRFKESLAGNILQLLPCAGGARVLRQWAGIADMTPDFSPIMGQSPLKNYYLDAGWGTWGFKATPAAGMTLAATIAGGETHPLIRPYALSRFDDMNLIGEKAAAAVGH